MKLNNRFIFGILSLLLAAVIAFVALPTIARQTNGKEEIVRITQPVLKGEQISSENAEVVEVGGYNLPSNIAHQLSDVNGLYATADLAVGDYILTSKISSVPVSSDVALNSMSCWFGPLGVDGTGSLYGLTFDYQTASPTKTQFYLLDDYYRVMNHLTE